MLFLFIGFVAISLIFVFLLKLYFIFINYLICIVTNCLTTQLVYSTHYNNIITYLRILFTMNILKFY